MSSGHSGRTGDVPDGKVKALVDRAVRLAAGTDSAEEAWKSLFGRGDRVAVKVNTLSGKPVATHPSVALAVVDGLISAGVEPGSIVVFDRQEREMARAGFSLGELPSGARVAATDSAGFGYGRRIIKAGSVGSLFSRIVTDFATGIVDVPVLKDHDLAGVTLALKNFFGVIHNPNKYHDNLCDPFVADLFACPYVGGLTRLVVMDALLSQVDGGPAYREDGAYPLAGVLAGTDAVAVDRVGWERIERLRAELGFEPLEAVGRKPRHILTAGEKGLGVSDLSRIEVVEESI